ncbi:LanC-like protein 3 homolog [Gryllus bimaculatus]|nr:LanC-like protein 3 homolog [Gryllus bimaculatus]
MLISLTRKTFKALLFPALCEFHLKFVSYSTMSQPKRYFLNKLNDYDGEEISVSENEWKQKLLQVVNVIKERQPPRVHDADGGLYVGVGGIGYMYYFLSQSPLCSVEKADFVKKGLNYIDASLSYIDSHKGDHSQKSAFLLGYAGIYAVAAVLNNSAGNKEAAEKYLRKYIKAADNCMPVHYLRCGGDELLVGRAGYLSGALWLEKELGNGTIPPKIMKNLCDSMIQSGREYARKYKSPCPLMFAYYDTEYLGAAHGLSTILQMILTVPGYLQSDPKAEFDVRTSVDYLLNLQTASGNFPCATDELGRRARSESDELVHWCHGAPGVVYLMAKAYLHWKDEKYLQACIKCGDIVWNKGLLKKGPGICHGVAGNAYVFLLLYRLTNDKKYLHRAQAFAQFMFTSEFEKGARTPDCPFSLYEGWAGSACFLADLARPQSAAFPFLDVF